MRNITEYHHQGKKQQAGIDVVVEGQGPEVPVHHRQNLLGVDGIQRDEEGGEDSKYCARQGETSGLIFLTRSTFHEDQQ